VGKFYNHEGANLLIPEEDMLYHEYIQENKPHFDVDEYQKKTIELEHKKKQRLR
jgi:hypothetical protein